MVPTVFPRLILDDFSLKNMGSRWRSSWDQIERRNLRRNMVWGHFGTETLRTVWFGEPEAPKPYAQYGLGPRDAETLRGGSRVQLQSFMMIYSWFSHSFRMVFAWWDRDLCPVPLFQICRSLKNMCVHLKHRILQNSWFLMVGAWFFKAEFFVRMVFAWKVLHFSTFPPPNPRSRQ